MIFVTALFLFLLPTHALSNPSIGFDELAKSFGFLADGDSCVKVKKKDSTEELDKKKRCLSLASHLRTDSALNCMPAQDRMISGAKVGTHKIRGHVTYLAVSPRDYGYDVEIDRHDNVKVTLKIFFQYLHKKNRKTILDEMKNKLERAARIWNHRSPPKVVFRFEAVNKRKEAHFIIPLTNENGRYPYDSLWSTQWNASNLAHEIGHMLGLNDEYDQLNRTLGIKVPVLETECDESSIMCQDYGVPKDFHYYLILRRTLCENKSHFDSLPF